MAFFDLNPSTGSNDPLRGPSFEVYDHTGKLSDSHKATEQDGVSHIRLGGQTVGKWTGSALTYLHVDHRHRSAGGLSWLLGTGAQIDVADAMIRVYPVSVRVNYYDFSAACSKSA